MSLVSFRAAGIVICLSALLFRFPVRYRPLLLLAGSLVFFAGSPDLLALHAAHTAFTLTLAFLMGRYPKVRKPLLATGILAHCVALVWLHGRGGFSYAALIHIGFLLDVGCGEKPDGIAGSAAALFYFPSLMEGPIIDAFASMELFYRPASPSWERCSHAALRIVAGLFKKLVVADRFAAFVNAVYSSPHGYGAGALWLAMLAYAVQVYMDFSGCMDVVLGVSSLIGIDLPENFSRPYLADSCSEYWHRWHITMGAWFKRRVFYPLATSIPMLKLAGRLTGLFRKSSGAGMAAAVPLLLTWALVGLWHGPELHYVLWGATNGLLILAERTLLSEKRRWPKAARIARTFLMMSLIRVLFRAVSVKSALQFYSGLFRFAGGAVPSVASGPGLLVAILSAAFLFLLEIRAEHHGTMKLSISSAMLLTTLGIAAVLVFGCYGPGYSPTEFFYSQF